MNILTVNLLFSTVVFWIAAGICVLPNIRRWGRDRVLMPILLLHALRHLGLMFLAPGATYTGLPPAFARTAALGDLVAALLALASLAAVRRSHPSARLLVWIFNVEGTLDLMVAITLATVNHAAPYMGPAYWIPAFWVPALLVTHYITFVILLGRWPTTRRSSAIGPRDDGIPTTPAAARRRFLSNGRRHRDDAHLSRASRPSRFRRLRPAEANGW
jgi:hypothetical protein